MGADALGVGREALRRGDVEAARAAFEVALSDGRSGEALEGLGLSFYLSGEYSSAVEAWEEAYAAYRAAGDHTGAVRMARMIPSIYLTVFGDRAVASGWLSRAQTLLGGSSDTAEAGWVALARGMFDADRPRKEELFREALAVARRVQDTQLEFVVLAYLGASLVHQDRTEEGMLLLDEALAAAAGGEVDDVIVLEEIFCQLFSACEHAHDVARADAWIRVGEAIAERRRLTTVAAFCRTHYGGVLTAAGRWPEADAALSQAVQLWTVGRRSGLRAGALVRLADLRVRQGRFEEAAQLLEDVDPDADHEAARPAAAVRLAAGDTDVAADILERALARLPEASTSAAPLLELLVDVHLSAGDPTAADAAAGRLESCAERSGSAYVKATAALARGRVCLASGTGDAQACLREALAGFASAQLPMELARSRLELAQALAGERPEVAMAEARTALQAFERLQAARHADAAAALLRSLGVKPASAPKGSGVLTRREAEVLDLLGHGLSNPEIAERLYISRKTVEHHVGNVLAKLGLRSRAEAAAYAVREKPARA